MDTDNDSNSNSFDMEDLWVPQLPHGVLMAIGVDREDVTSLANNPQAAGSSNNTEAEQSQNKNTGVRTLMPSAIGVGGDQHANGHGKEDTYKTPAPKKRAAQSHMRSLLADSPDDFSPLRLDEGSASRVTGQLDTPWRQPDQRNRFITPLHARALNLPVGWSPSLETPLPNGKQRAVTPGHIASLLRRRQFQSLAAQESPTAWATVGPRSRSPEGTPPVMPAIAPAEQIRVLHEESRMSNVEKPKALSADRALGRLLANRLGNARRETSVKENDFSSLTPGVKVSGTGVKWLTPFLGQQKPKPLAKSNTRQIRSAEGRPKRMLLTPRTADPSPSKNDFDDMFANQFVREPSLTAVPSLHNALQGEAAKRNADQAMRDETPLNAKRKRRGGTVTKIQDIVGPEQIQPLELSDIIGTVPTTYVSSNQSRKPNKRRKSKGDFPKLTVQSHCVTPSEDLTTQAAPTGDDLSFWATTIPTRVPKPNFDVVGTSTITASGRSTTASIAIGRAEQNPFQERPQEERKRGRKLRHSDPQGNVRRSERIRRGESGCSSTKEIKHMKAKPGTARTPAPAPASPVARRSAPYSNEHTRRLKKEALDTFESIFSSSPLSDVSVLSSPESVYSKKSDAGRKRGMMIKAASPCLPSSSQSAHRELCAMSSDLFNAAGGSEPHSPPRPSPVYDAKATNNGPGAAPILISSSPAKAQSPVAREIPARLSSPQSKSPDDNDRVDIADLMNILEIPSITPPNKRKRDLGSKAPYRNGLLLQTSELDSIPSDVESDGDAAHTVAVGDGVPSTATAAEAPANSMIVETQEEDDFPHIGSPALLEPTARSQGIEMEGSLDATCSQQLLLISSPVGSNHVELNLIASIAETIKHEHIDTQSSVTQMTSITDDVDTQSVVTQKTTIIDNIETQSSVTQKTTIIDNADTQSTATQKTTIIDTGQDVIPATLSLTPRLNRAEVKMKQAVIDVPSSPESQTQGSECDSPSIFRRFPMMATGSVGSLNLVMPTRLGKEVGTDHDSDRTESLPQREDDELIHVLDADDDIRARSATLDIEDKREMGLPVHSSPPPSRHVQDFDDTQEDTQDGGDDHRYGVPLTLEVAVETAEDASTRSATPGVAEKQAMGPLAHSSPVRSQHVQDFNDTQDETREAHDEYHLSGPRALETTDVREEAVNGRTQDNRTAAGKISSKAPVPGGHAARSPPVDDLKDQAATILASRSPVTCAASPKCVAHADVDDASVMSAGSSPIIAASQASLTGAVNDSFKLPNQYDEAERTQRAKAVRWDTDEVEHPPLGVQSDVDDDDEYGDDYGHSMLSAVHGITQKLKVEADFPRTQPGFYDAYTIEDDDISASFERALNQTNTQPAQSVPLSAPIPPPFHAPAFKDQDPEPAEQGLINFAFASGKQLKPNMSTIRRFAQFVDQELSADANPMCASGGGLGSGRASVSFAPKSLGDLRREVRGWRTPLGEGDGMTVVKEVPHAADEGTNTPMDYREPPLNETAPGRSGGQRDRHGEGDENCHHEFPPLIQDFAISKDRDSPTTISGDDYSILAEPFGAARIEAAHDVSFEVPVHRINGNQSAVPEATVAHNTGASEYYGGQISDTVQSEVRANLLDNAVGIVPNTPLGIPAYETAAMELEPPSALASPTPIRHSDVVGAQTPFAPPKAAFAGFSTGRGKALGPVSKQAQQRAVTLGFNAETPFEIPETPVPKKRQANLVEQSTSEEQQLSGRKVDNLERPAGFMSASGKGLPPISRNAQIHARALGLLEEDVVSDVHTPVRPRAGLGARFTGGTGEKLGEPSRAVQECSRVIGLYDGPRDNAIVDDPTPATFPVNERSARWGTLETPVRPSVGGFAGFSTGTGKKLPGPSNAARERARLMGLYDGANESMIVDEPTPVSSPVKARSAPSYPVETPIPPKPAGFSGFSTGTGKKLREPSGAARERARLMGLYDGTQDEPTPASFPAPVETPVQTKPAFTGFSTGTGRKMAEPSGAARERARLMGLYDGMHNSAALDETSAKSFQAPAETPVHREVAAFPGFSTGTGRQMTEPSGAARERARLMGFVDGPAETRTDERDALAIVETPRPKMDASYGFSSGSGKALPKISEAATRKARALGLYPEDETLIADTTPQETPCRPSRPSMMGFASGTGKDLPKLSLEAQEKAKAMGFAESNGSRVTLGSPANSGLGALRNGADPQNHDAVDRSGLGRITSMSCPSKRRLNGDTSNFPLAATAPVSPTSLMTPRMAKSGPVDRNRKPFRPLRQKVKQVAAVTPGDSALAAKPTTQPPTRRVLFDFTASGERQSLRKRVDASSKSALAHSIPAVIASITLHTAHLQRFEKHDGDTWGLDDAKLSLVEAGASPTLLTDEWMRNHYQLILWNLAGLVRSFPDLMEQLWQPAAVIHRLCYRYEREINRAERSAVKLIVERDNVPDRFMVLCISQIAPEPRKATSVWHLELTDGWYTIKAKADEVLLEAIRQRKLFLGMKIRVCGSQLGGPAKPCPVLEVTDKTHLVLSANGTRRAPWDALLGYQRPRSFVISLRHLSADGGLVPAIDVIICRRYPMRYYEKSADGVGVVRTQKEEEEAAARWQKHYSSAMQEIAGQLEKEAGKSETRSAQNLTGRVALSEIQDGEELHEHAKAFGNHAEFISKLETDQRHALEDAMRESHEKQRAQLSEDLREQLETVAPPRNVITFLTFRVCDYPPDGIPREKTGQSMLTIWGPDEGLLARLVEGKRFKIFNLIPKENSRDKLCPVYLRAQRNTQYVELPSRPQRVEQTLYSPRVYTTCAKSSPLPSTEEIDLVLVVIDIGDPSQHVFGTGTARYETNLICTNEHGEFVVVEIISKTPTVVRFKPWSILFCRNLEYMGYDPGCDAYKLKAAGNAELLLSDRSTMGQKLKQSLTDYIETNEGNIRQEAAARRFLIQPKSGVNVTYHTSPPQRSVKDAIRADIKFERPPVIPHRINGYVYPFEWIERTVLHGQTGTPASILLSLTQNIPTDVDKSSMYSPDVGPDVFTEIALDDGVQIHHVRIPPSILRNMFHDSSCLTIFEAMTAPHPLEEDGTVPSLQGALTRQRANRLSHSHDGQLNPATLIKTLSSARIMADPAINEFLDAWTMRNGKTKDTLSEADMETFVADSLYGGHGPSPADNDDGVVFCWTEWRDLCRVVSQELGENRVEINVRSEAGVLVAEEISTPRVLEQVQGLLSSLSHMQYNVCPQAASVVHVSYIRLMSVER